MKRGQENVCVIPTDVEFQILTEILPILLKVKTMSDSLSSDVKPTIQNVIPMLVNLHGVLADKQKMPLLTGTKQFCKALAAEIEERLPKCGTDNKFRRLACLLNPVYRGQLLKKREVRVKTINRD